jgi:hypothetical protein
MVTLKAAKFFSADLPVGQSIYSIENCRTGMWCAHWQARFSLQCTGGPREEKRLPGQSWRARARQPWGHFLNHTLWDKHR